MSEFAVNNGEGWSFSKAQAHEQESVDLSALEKHGFIPLVESIDVHGLMIQLDQHKNIGYGKHFGFGFHSISKEGRDEKVIEKIDLGTYTEVETTNGFHVYLPGERDQDTRKCMSICVWRSLETAHITLKNSKMHKLAEDMAKYFYDVGVVEYLDIDYAPDSSTVSYIMPPHELKLG